MRTQVVTSPEARTSVYLFQDIADASSLHGEGEKRSLLHIFSETIENIRGTWYNIFLLWTEHDLVKSEWVLEILMWVYITVQNYPFSRILCEGSG